MEPEGSLPRSQQPATCPYPGIFPPIPLPLSYPTSITMLLLIHCLLLLLFSLPFVHWFLSFPHSSFTYLLLFPLVFCVSRLLPYYVPSQAVSLRCYPSCNIPTFILLDISYLRTWQANRNEPRRVDQSLCHNGRHFSLHGIPIYLQTNCPYKFVVRYLLFTVPTCFGHRIWPLLGSHKLHRGIQHTLRAVIRKWQKCTYWCISIYSANIVIIVCS
jgi:hypothetical protein